MNKNSVAIALLIVLAILGYGWMQRDASIRQSTAIERSAETRAAAELKLQKEEARRDASNRVHENTMEYLSDK